MFDIVKQAVVPAPDQPMLILAMRENRSKLGRDARRAVLALVLALMAVGILPVLKGLLFVPIAAMSGLALLKFALEWHARSVPASELLEIADGVVRHRDGRGRIGEVSLRHARLRTIGRDQVDLRLFVETRRERIEIGRCLAPAERSAVAALIEQAIAGARQDLRGAPLWA